MTEKSSQKRLDLLSFPSQSQVNSNAASTQHSVVRNSVQPPRSKVSQSKPQHTTSVAKSKPKPKPTKSTVKTRRKTGKSKPKLEVIKVSPASTNKKRSTKAPKVTSKSTRAIYSALFILLKVTIITLGGAAIVGTILAAVNQNHQLSAKQSDDTNPVVVSDSPPEELKLLDQTESGAEISGLIAKLEPIFAKYPDLEPGVFLLDLDNQGYVNFSGSKSFSAASTIKIPILVALLEAIDAGTVYWDEQLVMEPELIADGSGDMQYQPPGKKYSLLETAQKMIIISDNTATNMIVERLGGQGVLNARFQEWGLNSTAINNPLSDLQGTNTTSPKDLVSLLQKIEQGELLSMRSRDRLLTIMRQTKTRSLLPQGLESGATIAHKTGDIRSMLGDAGIVDMPTGKRYIAAVLVNRPDNDPQAKKLIQEVSRTAYQHFKYYQPRESFTDDDE